MITADAILARQLQFSARIVLCDRVALRAPYCFVTKPRVRKSNVGNKGRMSKGDVMSERDNTSISVAAGGACCRIRRRMQCFGFQGNAIN